MNLVTIHDTNILIDIIELELLGEFFNLDFKFHTTDFVLNEISQTFQKQEIKKFQSEFMIKTFDSSSLIKLADIHNTYKTLSIEDISVMELATEIDGILCTGDKALKTIARLRGVEVHGVLWIISQLVQQGVLSKDVAVIKLQKLKTINIRLPNSLIDKAIKNLIINY